MTLFYHETGPLVSYKDGTLYISDLNPQLDTKWRMSRKELLGFAWRTFKAAVIG